MPHTVPVDSSTDTGLACLAILARFLGIAADTGQLKHKFARSQAAVSSDDLIRAARHVGLKARRVSSDWKKLAKTPLPALAQHQDGHWVVIAKADAERVLVQDPLENRPLTLPKAIFEPAWSGTLILLTRRALLSDQQTRFGFRWFVPALIKYRKLFGEVLLASFFLQLFALITPLFFQVVIDKVLVHKGLTTLDVLALGLIVVSIFEVVLGGLRTYVFSHTTNRVDVELGAKLYRHLLSLPMSYFGARRVGDSVARGCASWKTCAVSSPSRR